MPFYYTINSSTTAGKRTANRLLELRKVLDEKIPNRTVNDTMLLATWNIRDFDNGKYGYRTDEAIFYMAEIISRFDLVAIQEVNRDLSGLERLMKVLGGWWDVVFNDVTEGRQGNSERTAFLYDSRKISFGGLAGELVIPPVDSLTPAQQLARTPSLVGFRCGWFKFILSTVHILYGDNMAEEPRRVKEIEELAKFLSRRANDQFVWSSNLIALGDFNIYKPTDSTFSALINAGFRIPEQLQRLPSNAIQNKHYDQIAFLAPSVNRQMNSLSAGVFNFFDYVFKEEDEMLYINDMGEAYDTKSDGAPRTNKTRYYKAWRTHQMSDHLPMWVELKIDFGKEYLLAKAAG